jgi:hypothetical protein
VPTDGVENVNLTHIVTQVRPILASTFSFVGVSYLRACVLTSNCCLYQHTHYCTMMKEILEEVNLAGTCALSSFNPVDGV